MAYEMFKVLLVDDNQVTLVLYEKFLAAQHYQVIRAKDGTEALQKAFSEKPDIILLDIMMPGISGYEVCAQLREAPSTADIPIIILTAMNRSTARQKALEMGADDFILKTEQLDSMEGRIKMLLKQRIMIHTLSWLADLAGSTASDYALRNQLQSGRPIAVMFLDIKGMNAINEQERYEDGDQVLWLVANILIEVTQERAKGDFIGYYGQDDFLVLTRPEAVEKLAATIVQKFEVAVLSKLQYPSGRREYPFLNIGIILIENGTTVHPGAVNHAGRTLLKEGVTQSGNTIQTTRLGP